MELVNVYAIDPHKALAQVFSEQKYRRLAVVSFIAVAVFSWALPILLIPGNSIEFSLQIAPWWSYLLLLAFSALMAMLIPMQAYIFSQKHSAARKGAGAASLFAGFASTIYASAACASCVSLFGAFLGGGAVLFMLNSRFELIAASSVLTLASVLFAAKTINSGCKECSIPQSEVKQIG